MRFEQLRYLESVARLRSFHAAAAELNVSQPTLSEQIRRLEEDLGVVLLFRGRGGTRLTSSGLSLLPHIHSTMASVESLRQAAGSLQGVRKGRIRLGAVSLASRLLLPKVVVAFRQSYPGVALQVTEKGSLEVEHGISEGIYDLGILSRRLDSKTSPDHEFEPLLNTRLAVCLPQAHRLAKKSVLSKGDVLEEPLVMYGTGFLMHEATVSLIGRSPDNIVHYTNNTETAIRMVKAGVGIAIISLLSESDELVDDSVRLLPIENSPDFALGLFRSTMVQPPPAVTALMRITRLYAARFA